VTELHEATAADQLRALRQRKISSRELTEHYLARIDRLGAPLGAFVTVTPDIALDAADRADALLATGEGGTLSGLPLGIKDLHATAGVPTTAGSAALSDAVPAQDSWTVALLRAAGAVIVGKTNTSELGATCYTEDQVAGHPAVTPFDTTRYSSGSSGGAATAVAAGLLPFAHGSDSAGSIRTPAATCNLVGVKPSRGLVSAAPATTYMALGTEGPIARTVEDAAILLDAMATPSSGDLYGWQPGESFATALRRAPERPLTIAMWTAPGLDGVTEDAEITASMHRTAEALRAEGHEVREIDVPVRMDAGFIAALRTWLTYAVATAATALVPPQRRPQLTELTRRLMTQARELSATDVLSAQGVLAGHASRFLAAFADFDVALTPTTTRPPVRRGHFHEDGIDGILDRMLAWSAPTPWANLTGQPAVALPAGFTASGLPLSAQLIGRPRTDTTLLSLAKQLESAQPFGGVHPDVWSR
jgi:amidase